MQNDDATRILINSPKFRERIKRYFHLDTLGPLEISHFSSGFSKDVYKCSSDKLPNAFLVKEIPFTLDLWGVGNTTLTVDDALHELDVIKIIKRKPGLKKKFSKNIDMFCVVHPQTHADFLPLGGIVPIEKAKALLEEERELSFFIIEEIAQGRKPTEEEVAHAKQIRKTGLKSEPKVWLTVDTDGDDFLVQQDGSFIFYDVGHFDDGTFSPTEQNMLRVMREMRQNNRQ